MDYKNPEALDSLLEGMEDAKEGRLRELDIDFSQFLDEENLENVQNLIFRESRRTFL
ncbi:MAG: hypothetical protein H0W88_03125 [Parachlamydiaceae bacterium]|nr:hypothetical protein [Parachlamydiaceae bacterium]